MNAPMMLSPDALAKIDATIAKYPVDQKQSAVMAALTIAQDEKGWLSTETMDFVARYLNMPPIAVYEVASFYAMYDLQPVGRHKLTLCTNLPCALQGANEAGEYLKRRLGISYNETTSDGRITLKEGECFGACGDAPVFLHNNKRMLCAMSPEKLDQLLRELDHEPAEPKDPANPMAELGASKDPASGKRELGGSEDRASGVSGLGGSEDRASGKSALGGSEDRASGKKELG